MLEILLSSGLLLANGSASPLLAAVSAAWSLPMLIGLGLGTLVMMALIVAVIQYRQRRITTGTLNSPTELWAELCRIHQLDKADSAVLRDLSVARAMEPAVSVFVRADLWQLERDTPELQQQRQQLQRLQEVLFAGSELQHKIIHLQ